MLFSPHFYQVKLFEVRLGICYDLNLSFPRTYLLVNLRPFSNFNMGVVFQKSFHGGKGLVHPSSLKTLAPWRAVRVIENLELFTIKFDRNKGPVFGSSDRKKLVAAKISTLVHALAQSNWREEFLTSYKPPHGSLPFVVSCLHRWGALAGVYTEAGSLSPGQIACCWNRSNPPSTTPPPPWVPEITINTALNEFWQREPRKKKKSIYNFFCNQIQ